MNKTTRADGRRGGQHQVPALLGSGPGPPFSHHLPIAYFALRASPLLLPTLPAAPPSACHHRSSLCPVALLPTTPTSPLLALLLPGHTWVGVLYTWSLHLADGRFPAAMTAADTTCPTGDSAAHHLRPVVITACLPRPCWQRHATCVKQGVWHAKQRYGMARLVSLVKDTDWRTKTQFFADGGMDALVRAALRNAGLRGVRIAEGVGCAHLCLASRTSSLWPTIARRACAITLCYLHRVARNLMSRQPLLISPSVAHAAHISSAAARLIYHLALTLPGTPYISAYNSHTNNRLRHPCFYLTLMPRACSAHRFCAAGVRSCIFSTHLLY